MTFSTAISVACYLALHAASKDNGGSNNSDSSAAAGAIIAAIATIGGAVVGAWLAVRLTRRAQVNQGKVDLALSLYNEFHSETIHSARSQTARAMTENGNSDLDAIKEAEDGREKLRGISRLLHYFEKIAVLGDAKALDKELMRKLCGDYLSYYTDYFAQLEAAEKQKPDTEWRELFANIKKLDTWFRWDSKSAQEHTPASQ